MGFWACEEDMWWSWRWWLSDAGARCLARGLFAQPHVTPEGRDEPIVRAGVKEGDLSPEIRLGRQ